MIISLSYEIIFYWNLDPKKLSLYQMNFSNSRYSSQNGQRSRMAECEICLWRLWFTCPFFFYCHICIERWGCSLSIAIKITSFWPLQLKFFIKHQSKVPANIRHKLEHGLNFISNLLIFESYIKNFI